MRAASSMLFICVSSIRSIMDLTALIYVVAAMSFLLNQMLFVVSDSKLVCGKPLQRHRCTLFIVRRYHEPRQGSCLFISICDRNRNQSCCEHASVCLGVTHGHHAGTL